MYIVQLRFWNLLYAHSLSQTWNLQPFLTSQQHGEGPFGLWTPQGETTKNETGRCWDMNAWWCNNHLEKWWSSSMGRMTLFHFLRAARYSARVIAMHHGVRRPSALGSAVVIWLHDIMRHELCERILVELWRQQVVGVATFKCRLNEFMDGLGDGFVQSSRVDLCTGGAKGTHFVSSRHLLVRSCAMEGWHPIYYGKKKCSKPPIRYPITIE